MSGFLTIFPLPSGRTKGSPFGAMRRLAQPLSLFTFGAMRWLAHIFLPLRLLLLSLFLLMCNAFVFTLFSRLKHAM